jgi:putative transposase
VPVFGAFEPAGIAKNVIIRYRDKGYYYLPAYCVMPDHVHMLLIPLHSGRHLSRIVATLKNAITRALKDSGVAVRWQWGYHDHVLRSAESTTDIARYIMMNPVRKGLVSDFRAWQFSGIVDRWF